MRSLFWLLAVFAAAVALVLLGRIDAGYAMLVYPPWRVEMSMVLFAVAVLALFALFYAGLRLARHTLALPTYVSAYRARRRRERAHAALSQAL
jgi:HemY protein